MAEFTTYREMVYMVQDLLKNASDDAYFTEDHIIFLFNKYRSMFIHRYYKNELVIPESLKQTICIDLEKDYDCIAGKETLKSADKIPDIIEFGHSSTGGITLGLGDYYSNYRLTYVPFQRFPFTNANRFLKRIIYIDISPDRKLNINVEGNPDASLLEKVNITAVFEDPSVVAEYSCDPTEAACDILDRRVYLDNTLQAVVIKAVVQDISFGLYKPKDNVNNAKDELSNNSVDSYVRNNNQTMSNTEE